jgi:hypothetical protein
MRHDRHPVLRRQHLHHGRDGLRKSGRRSGENLCRLWRPQWSLLPRRSLPDRWSLRRSGGRSGWHLQRVRRNWTALLPGNRWHRRRELQHRINLHPGGCRTAVDVRALWGRGSDLLPGCRARAGLLCQRRAALYSGRRCQCIHLRHVRRYGPAVLRLGNGRDGHVHGTTDLPGRRGHGSCLRTLTPSGLPDRGVE